MDISLDPLFGALLYLVFCTNLAIFGNLNFSFPVAGWYFWQSLFIILIHNIIGTYGQN